MLTNRMQIQVIADHLAGLVTPDLSPRDFCEPWRTIYQALLDLPEPQSNDHREPRSNEGSPNPAAQALLHALDGRDDRDAIIGAILAAVPGESPDFPSLREIAASLPPISWLWPDWIPQGMISLLGSVPGAGKSYLALDLARRVIAGQPFPDGAPVPQTDANVLYVDAEDVPQIINQRAEAWAMDTSRLYLLRPDDRPCIDFSQPRDRDQLVDMCYMLRPALIVIDSLSTVSSQGENNVEDVRGVLAFLNRLAQRFQCALLLIHHLRKRGLLGATDALSVDDFRGSSHIIAVARLVLGLSVVQTGPQPDRNGPRRLEVVKTNLARYPDPLGVQFLPTSSSGVTLQYGTSPQPYRDPTKLELTMEWLLETLQTHDKPAKPADVVEMAQQAGYGRATLYKARARLGRRIRDTDKPRSPKNRWELAPET